MDQTFPAAFVIGNPKENEADLRALLELAERTALIYATEKGMGNEPDPYRMLMILDQFMGKAFLQTLLVQRVSTMGRRVERQVLQCGKWHVFLDQSTQCLLHEDMQDYIVHQDEHGQRLGQAYLFEEAPTYYVISGDEKTFIVRAVSQAWSQMQHGSLIQHTPRVDTKPSIKRF